MKLDWTDFPDAPAPGTRICALSDLREGVVSSFDLAGFAVLLMALDGGVRCYVNACPHQFLPLDLRAHDIVSADGKHLLCSNHAAMFRVADGQGVAGEGVGCALSPVPLEIRAAGVFILR